MLLCLTKFFPLPINFTLHCYIHPVSELSDWSSQPESCCHGELFPERYYCVQRLQSKVARSPSPHAQLLTPLAKFECFLQCHDKQIMVIKSIKTYMTIKRLIICIYPQSLTILWFWFSQNQPVRIISSDDTWVYQEWQECWETEQNVHLDMPLCSQKNLCTLNEVQWSPTYCKFLFHETQLAWAIIWWEKFN